MTGPAAAVVGLAPFAPVWFAVAAAAAAATVVGSAAAAAVAAGWLVVAQQRHGQRERRSTAERRPPGAEPELAEGAAVAELGGEQQAGVERNGMGEAQGEQMRQRFNHASRMK